MAMDWDKLRIFHAVAEAGSFTHAGDTLNLSQSAVSRQISALEDSIKSPLFHRHARGLILTEQGEILYQTVKDVFHKLSMAQAQLAESLDRPMGPLKITTTIGFGSTWLTRHMTEFVDLYPDVEVSLFLTDQEVDLGMRKADVAIRMTEPRQPDLVQRPLMEIRGGIFGLRSYFDEHGRPATPEDLDKHKLIVFGEDTPLPVASVNWLMSAGADQSSPRRPVLRINNSYGIYRAVMTGLGIASLPEYMVRGVPEIEQVLPDVEGPVTRAYFVYPEELRHSQRIAVFRDFLLRKVAEERKAKSAS